jgi:hypothetical protein
MAQLVMYRLELVTAIRAGKEWIVEKESVLKKDLVNTVLKYVNAMKIIQKCAIRTMESAFVKLVGVQ